MALDWLPRDDALKNHALFGTEHWGTEAPCTLYERRPVLDRDGNPVEGLYTAWITLNNPAQLNSYTTEMAKGVIAGFQAASQDRSVVAAVFTAVGERAFCTGGNTKEYAEYYSRRPNEYGEYMDIFIAMVDAILGCKKPVICRVNGMRIAGGQEIGMACDFTIAGDHARFGQAGPIHGSAPDGGSTDFLHLYVGFSRAADSLALCEQWSAHKALRYGLINEIAPVHKNAAGEFIANPFVVTDYVDEFGNIIHGDFKSGAAKADAKALIKTCTIDLSRLDKAVDKMVTMLMHTFPDCTRKTLESARKKKLEHWLANCESSRSWLALNMNTEAAAGFPAFHYGDRGEREIDFAALRRLYAEGKRFDRDMINAVLPENTVKRMADRPKDE